MGQQTAFPFDRRKKKYLFDYSKTLYEEIHMSLPITFNILAVSN
jgi:hypothetical protein